MPWKETCSMREKVRFVMEYERGDVSMSELCRMYGVSRKTGYAVVVRFGAEGFDGLQPRSHAPHHCPHALSSEVCAAVIALRGDHPTWGPKKVKARLAVTSPDVAWPAASTIGAVLARAGLVRTRKRRPYLAARTTPLAHAAQANDVWCIDLKGWFKTGDGRRCEPLTLVDAASRYLLRCVASERHDVGTVWPLLDAAFREYGLPGSMRSDNGPPFGSTGAGRLSPLAVRLVKAGVAPDHIDPGKPQQNGRLERPPFGHVNMPCRAKASHVERRYSHTPGPDCGSPGRTVAPFPPHLQRGTPA